MVNSLTISKLDTGTSSAPIAGVIAPVLLGGPVGVAAGADVSSPPTLGDMANVSSPSSIDEDCKPSAVKLEMLDEIFGYGWDGGSSITDTPPALPFSSLTPITSVATSTPDSLVLTPPPPLTQPRLPQQLKLPITPVTNAAALGIKTATVTSSNNTLSSVAAVAAAISPRLEPASPVISAQPPTAGPPGGLKIVIPSHPDTTTTSPSSAGSNNGQNSAGSNGTTKKTVFTAKGKTRKEFHLLFIDETTRELVNFSSFFCQKNSSRFLSSFSIDWLT